MNIGAIIPAAGQGKRMEKDINKQYLQLGDRPLLAHTLEVFANNKDISQIIVVVRKNEMDYCQKNILDKYNFKDIKLVAGGETRQQSVYAGLKAFLPATNYVIIHDGARPLISKNLLNKVIKKAPQYKALTTAVSVKDTIKIVNKENYVEKTPDRNSLKAVQTPQAFSYELIYKAHANFDSNLKVTDDASLVEKMGHKVKVIQGENSNIKITTPIDLVYAQNILEKNN
ncbi:MAG TPA: 2-C-methyl-D-erythritol 4-phosphate cytidylyltransferase [Halanaerobiales bacterium]|nr:2-C-methyl-D-erythritol 4-phosphate cytidylyltransferase [Halanaerobiales bacterium]